MEETVETVFALTDMNQTATVVNSLRVFASVSAKEVSSRPMRFEVVAVTPGGVTSNDKYREPVAAARRFKKECGGDMVNLAFTPRDGLSSTHKKSMMKSDLLIFLPPDGAHSTALFKYIGGSFLSKRTVSVVASTECSLAGSLRGGAVMTDPSDEEALFASFMRARKLDSEQRKTRMEFLWLSLHKEVSQTMRFTEIGSGVGYLVTGPVDTVIMSREQWEDDSSE